MTINELLKNNVIFSISTHWLKWNEKEDNYEVYEFQPWNPEAKPIFSTLSQEKAIVFLIDKQ